MALKFNPFMEEGITDYRQYEKMPFLKVNSVKEVDKIIGGLIRDNFVFPERLILIGERGIGKTTTLFYLKDKLEESKKVNVFILSNLIKDNEELKMEIGHSLNKLLDCPTFILIDFPDNVQNARFSKFLNYLWELMTHKNYDKINFIFALNKSHYRKSEDFSEILGKFHKYNLERLNFEETTSLIKSRLEMVGNKEFFDDLTNKMIFDYSKGIPRNIVCASRYLCDNFFEEKNVTEKMARQILKSDYIDQIINDRLESLQDREIYRGFIKILEEEFSDTFRTQEDFIKSIRENLGIGRNKSMRIISELNKFGLINITIGGLKNNTKIISLR